MGLPSAAKLPEAAEDQSGRFLNPHVGIEAQSTGIARAAYEASVQFAREREAFGAPIGTFQMIQAKLADMKCRLEASRLLTYRAAWSKHEAAIAGRRNTLEASIAKLFASEAAMYITHQAVQIHGGYGFMNEFPVARFYRDAKVLEIGEGTSEVQRMIIARSLGISLAT